MTPLYSHRINREKVFKLAQREVEFFNETMAAKGYIFLSYSFLSIIDIFFFLFFLKKKIAYFD